MGKTLESLLCYCLLLFLFVFVFLFLVFCTSSTASFELFRCPSARTDFYSQDFGRRVKVKMAASLFRARRILSGPGSSPPRCNSKCGSCTPCYPVRVPVPPGTSTPVNAEYYPEAWRCKCGNKLYMP